MYQLLRAHDKIRQAKVSDFDAIQVWRDQHFERMLARKAHPAALIRQATFATAAWAVYVNELDEPIAAVGFRDDPVKKIRWGTDVFTAPTPAGLRAGLALGRMLEAMSDADGYTIYGETDPENVEYLEHLMRRGYERTLVQFRRTPRAQT